MRQHHRRVVPPHPGGLIKGYLHHAATQSLEGDGPLLAAPPPLQCMPRPDGSSSGRHGHLDNLFAWMIVHIQLTKECRRQQRLELGSVSATLMHRIFTKNDGQPLEGRHRPSEGYAQLWIKHIRPNHELSHTHRCIDPARDPNLFFAASNENARDPAPHHLLVGRLELTHGGRLEGNRTCLHDGTNRRKTITWFMRQRALLQQKAAHLDAQRQGLFCFPRDFLARRCMDAEPNLWRADPAY